MSAEEHQDHFTSWEEVDLAIELIRLLSLQRTGDATQEEVDAVNAEIRRRNPPTLL